MIQKQRLVRAAVFIVYAAEIVGCISVDTVCVMDRMDCWNDVQFKLSEKYIKNAQLSYN